DALPARIDNVGADTERRPREGAGVHRVIGRTGEDAAADFCTARNVNDRNLLFADMLEEPLPGHGGPGLAAGGGHPQTGKIVIFNLEAIAHQAAHDRRRYAEVSHPMIGYQTPKTSGVRIIRRAFRYQQAAASETRDAGAHRTDHPAHVAEKEEAVGRFEVPADDHVARYHRADKPD